MVEVQVKEKESFERALRRFKKMWERAGVLREIRTRSFYEKPSDAKREARKKTLKNWSVLQNNTFTKKIVKLTRHRVSLHLPHLTRVGIPIKAIKTASN